jgi:bifunctional DNase/RNase
VTALGEKVISVTITELIEGTFYATVNFANHDSISARPSDAVALALQSGAPVLVSSEVMDTAALDVIDDVDEESDEAEEVEKFRAFLDEINPEDFS